MAAMAMLFAVSPAKAGLLANTLSFDGLVDTLDDDSEALDQDNNGNGIVDVGDTILGVLRIGKTTASGNLADNEQLVGIFPLSSRMRILPPAVLTKSNVRWVCPLAFERLGCEIWR